MRKKPRGGADRRRGFLKMMGATGVGVVAGIGKFLIPEAHAQTPEFEQMVESGAGWEAMNLDMATRDEMFQAAMSDSDCALLIALASSPITPSILIESAATEMEKSGEYRMRTLVTPFVRQSNPGSTTPEAFLVSGSIESLKPGEEGLVFPLAFIAFSDRRAYAAYQGQVQQSAAGHQPTENYVESLFDPNFAPPPPKRSSMKEVGGRIPCKPRPRMIPPCKKDCALDCAQRCGASAGFGAACAATVIACGVAWYTVITCGAAVVSCGASAWWLYGCWRCGRRCEAHNAACDAA